MAVRRFPITADAGDIDDYVCDRPGEIAVEVFDAPDAHYSERHGALIGPWIVGPRAEVYAALGADGSEDYEEQYWGPWVEGED